MAESAIFDPDIFVSFIFVSFIFESAILVADFLVSFIFAADPFLVSFIFVSAIFESAIFVSAIFVSAIFVSAIFESASFELDFEPDIFEADAPVTPTDNVRRAVTEAAARREVMRMIGSFRELVRLHWRRSPHSPVDPAAVPETPQPSLSIAVRSQAALSRKPSDA